MKVFRSLISFILILAIMMSITGSALHFHYCYSSGDYFMDFHFPGHQSEFHKECYCHDHLINEYSKDQADLCCDHESSPCLDIISSSDTDDSYHFITYSVNFQSPEFETFSQEHDHMISSGNSVSNQILHQFTDTSPPEIITSRILLL